MANLRKWSRTATGNASIAGGVSTINFAEGQLPSTVNNSMREALAQIRNIYVPDEWGWVEHSASVSVATQTTFKIGGNQTSNWTAGRRWRLKSSSSTRYGSVVSSSFTTETTVTVTVDSGSLSASHSLAALAAIDSNHIPPNTFVTSASLVTALGTYLTSASAATAFGNYATSNSVSVMIAAALVPYAASNSVSAMIATQVAAAAGGTTFLGTITTTSGASANLGSLTLTDYKFVKLVWNAVGHNIGGTGTFLIGNSTADDVACTGQISGGNTVTGIMEIELNTGVGSFSFEAGGTGAAFGFDSALSTSTTTITVAPQSGAFDAGSIRVYGVK